MIERFLILVAVAAVVAIGWLLLRVIQARRVRRLAEKQIFGELVPVGRPAVVAFTLPNCADCRARQAPALNRLRAHLGEQVAVVTLMVSDHPELADRLGLMTVPATAVLDERGTLRHLNQGFADEGRLLGQLNAAP
jgi:thiol-disulfide isomerase/thioredoxin